jgi:hypothetical protein
MFNAELQRLGGAPATGFGEEAAPFQRAPPPGPKSYSVPVQTRGKISASGLIYEPRQGDTALDMSWLFSPTAGHLRMADDRLRGRVVAGQFLHFDRSTPPREGQVCVVETTEGLIPYIYQELTEAGLTVSVLHPEPRTTTLDLANVRGVYAVRLIGE